MEYVVFLHGVRIGACVLILAIGSYLYAVGLCKRIKESLFAIIRSTQTKTDQSILLGEIIEFIELHSSAQQLRANQKSNLELNKFFYSFYFRFPICPE